MPSLEETLSRLEETIKSLVEGSVTRLLGAGDSSVDLTKTLVSAMQASLRQTDNGTLEASDQFTLVINSDVAQAVQADPGYLVELEHRLSEVAQRSGWALPGKPIIQVVVDAACAAPRAQARYSVDGLQTPTTARLTDIEASPQQARKTGAFLIVDGLRTFPLIETVVDIGRDPGNHLVLEDPRVSRHHAQLRLVQERFVIFDLDSTGGTYVNDRAVTRHPLSPGDVISLAGLPLVFGQEMDAFVGRTQELVSTPPSAEE